MKFQIINWDQHFENDRSRTTKKCSFVCVPNKQHGLGFCRIMAESDGSAIYGIWCLILGACSQQLKREGWLTENGEQGGSAWGAEDLALKFRRPEKEVARALQFLCSKQVGWIMAHDDGQLTANSRPTPLEGRKEENEKNEGKESIYSPESRVALNYLNEKSGKHFRECESSLAPISARLKESGVTIDGVKKMIERQCAKWKGDPTMDDYLRPSTLFGKEKFEAYYAAKDAPLVGQKPQKPVGGNL